MALSIHSTLKDLVTHLPFSLTDVRQANRIFARWQQHGRPEDKQIVDLWTYCFIRNYYLFKFIQQPARGIADFDELVERTLRKVEERCEQVVETGKFAAWVCVVCRNTYFNYLRTRRRIEDLDRLALPAGLESPSGSYDRNLILLETKQAIKRLPPFLQDVANLYFLESYSYVDIKECTGKSLPIIRSYVNKAIKKFRRDPRLRPFIEDLAARELRGQAKFVLRENSTRRTWHQADEVSADLIQ